jgi:glutathione S-transferase
MDLYYIPESPPCRGVLLVGAALGIDFNLIRVSMKNGEHMTPEYLQVFFLEFSVNLKST